MKSTKENTNWDVVVIGGGPSGLMAAGTAAKFGAKVLLLEKNEIMGKKLLISGGGRCNMTNAEPDERVLLSKYGKKGNFLFTPFSIFGVKESINFFESLGVKTKVENLYRVFPVSDKSADVLGALTKSAEKFGVTFRISDGVQVLKKKDKEIESVILENGEEIKAKAFILATGGKSRPETGSTGDGFKWLKDLGHKVEGSNPSLVPIITKEDWVAELSGITLDSVGVSVWKDGKKEFGKKGRILFTHDGLSGPTIINMSKQISDLLEGTEYENKPDVKVSIDFFPGAGLDMMHEKILKLFELNPIKKIKNITINEIPTKVYMRMLDNLGIDGEWNVNEVRRHERIAFVDMCKRFELTVDKLHGYEKAIISSGGVDLNEVDFKEMKSKLYKNLFLIGDILDFDRPSGGYSLQLCWTTGYVAGKSAAKVVEN
jgi:predicted Rossmann fold flavoprotein